jgi:hypothetical protein
MQTRTVLSVDFDENDGNWRIAHSVSGEGLPHLYIIKPAEFDYRAAEYGIDPMDSKTLLDINLHERFITTMDPTHPQYVYNTDEATARENYLHHIGLVKQNLIWEDPDSLLDAVHQKHQELHNPQLHADHRKFTAALRAENMNGKKS